MDIAYKYAIAFLNVYNGRLTFDDIKNIDEAAQFLSKHRRALFLLKVPIIKQRVKQEGLHNICRRFKLVDEVYNLVTLLLKHKRAYLLADVFKAIVYWYQRRHNITNILIKSSMLLPQSYRDDIVHFVDRHVSGIKQYRFEIDPTLIAGIRIQSDTILWENSIDKRLRELAHASI
jgi:F-type H+-transporting ATPase subunit delta